MGCQPPIRGEPSLPSLPSPALTGDVPLFCFLRTCATGQPAQPSHLHRRADLKRADLRRADPAADSATVTAADPAAHGRAEPARL